METHFGNINCACKGPPIKFLNVSEKIIKFQSLSINPPMHHRVEDKCVVRAWGKSQSKSHLFNPALIISLSSFLQGSPMPGEYSRNSCFQVRPCSKLLSSPEK